jgi:hypothetical protein
MLRGSPLPTASGVIGGATVVPTGTTGLVPWRVEVDVVLGAVRVVVVFRTVLVVVGL